MACYTYKNNKYQSREELESFLIEEQIQFSKSLNNVGINLITNGLTYKDSKTGKDIVILNKDTADDSTSIHEFSHIFSKWQKKNRPELWKKGQDLVKAEIVSENIEDLQDRLLKENKDLKTLFLSQSGGILSLDMIEVEKSQRSKGVGSKVISDIINYADKNGLTIDLVPSVKDENIGTTSKNRLIKFYKDLGFVENKGKTKDFARRSGGMYKLPDSSKKSEIQEIEDYVKQTQPKLKEGSEAFYDEVLQEFIGRESRNMMDEQKQKSPLMQWLSDFWEEIRKMLSLTSMTPEQVANLNLKEFARASVVDLLSGEYIGQSALDNGINRQVIGEIGASRIQEYNNLLNQAKELEKQGKDYSETGWYKGVDGWKYLSKEAIEDFKIINKEENKVLKLKEVLGNENVLFKIYPEMQEISVVFLNKNKQGYEKFKPIDENTAGEFNPSDKTIRINIFYQDNAQTLKEVQYTLGHEVSHYGQRLEGFSRGGNGQTVLKEALDILSIKGDGKPYGLLQKEIREANKSNLTKNQFKIVEDSLKTINALMTQNIDVLKQQYKRLMGEIDANIVGDLVSKGTARGTYADLLSMYLNRENMDPESIYYISGNQIQFSIRNQSQTQVIEPQPNFNGYPTYKEAVDNTPLNENIEIRIDDVVIGEVNANNAVNDLVRQNIIQDRRELQPNGDIVFKTVGNTLASKLASAYIAREVLGGSVNNSGDIRVEQKQTEPEIFETFEANKKEYGETTAIAVLASDAIANNTPTFGGDRIINEEVEVESEIVLMSKLKNLLNKLGVKTMNLEAWEKRFGQKANSNALADIANRIVAFAEGQFNEDTLSEETAHFIIEALDQEKLKPLLDTVHKTDEWKEYAQTYMEVYEGNEALVRKEVLGKVLKNALQNKANQQTLQGQSVLDRLVTMFSEFLERFRALFTEDYKKQFEQFSDEVYLKLMSEELFEELTPSQLDGNKLVMYQINTTDTVYQSINKMLKQSLVIDRKTLGTHKNTLEEIEKKLDETDKKTQLEALAGIASTLKKHINYLNTRGKKQGFLSVEEKFVYSTTQNLGKVLESIMPKIDNIDFSTYGNVYKLAKASATDSLNALTELTGNLNKEKEDRFSQIVNQLAEQNNLTESQKDILAKELASQDRDTNLFYSLFGGIIHAQNQVLNMLAKRVSRMNKETEVVFSGELNTFFSELNKQGFKDEQVASLFKKWARGYHIFSPYNFKAFEEATMKEKLKAYNQTTSKNISLEEFIKDEEVLKEQLSQEDLSKYRFLSKKYLNESGIKIDSLTNEERTAYNDKIKQLNLSEKTEKLISEFKDRRGEVYRKASLARGYSEEDLQQLREINTEYQAESDPYDNNGNLKKGLYVDENNEVLSLVPKEDLTDGSRTTLELNQYRKALTDMYSKTEGDIFSGFYKEVKAFREQAQKTNPNGWLADTIEFIKLNSRIFLTENFWNNFNTNDSIVQKLREKNEDVLADKIEKQNRKLKNILKRNKEYGNPSEIDYENMSGAERREVRDIVTTLESYFKDAKALLPKETTKKAKSEEYSIGVNNAYVKELGDRNIAQIDTQEKYNEKLAFIRQHVTDEGNRAISRMLDRIDRAEQDGYQELPKGLEGIATLEELESSKEEVIIKYAETKLLPYFKATNPKGISSEAIISQMANAQNVTLFKYSATLNPNISINPAFIFEDATTSTRLNPEFKSRIENNEPLMSDKFLNDEFFNYFGITKTGKIDIENAVATQNQKEFEAWKALIKFQEKAIAYGGASSMHNKYLLPQYRRRAIARILQIASNTSLENIKQGFKDAFTYREDNPELGQTPDGDIAQLYQKNNIRIPKTGFRKLESEEEVTNELLYSYMLMMKEAVKYKKRTEAWADVEAMEHFIKGKNYAGKEAERANTYKMFSNFVSDNIYGQKETFKYEVDLFGMLPRKYNIAPAINHFQTIIRNNNLAFAVLTPMTSFLQGSTNFIIENIVGDRINRDAARLAAKETAKLLPKAVTEHLNVKANSKLNKIYQFVGTDNSVERFNNSNYGRAVRTMPIGKSGYLTHYAADAPLQAQVVLTVLHDFRVVNGDLVDYRTWRRQNKQLSEKVAKAEWKQYQDQTLYNYLEETEKGIEVSQALKDMNIPNLDSRIQFVRDKITIAKAEVDNQISEGDKGLVQRHALFSMLTLHRGWLVTSMTRRFKSKHLNLMTNMTEEGSYLGAMSFLSQAIRETKKKGFSKSWKEAYRNYDGGYKLDGNTVLDEKGDVFRKFANEKEAQEYYDDLVFDFSKMRQASVRRALLDFVVTHALVALGIALSQMADDDKEDFKKQFVAYTTYRLASEVTSQSLGFGSQAYQFIESPTVGLSQIQTAIDFLDMFDSTEIERGNFKGYTKREAWFIKALPGIKEYDKINNMYRTRKTYEFYNEKTMKFTISGHLMLED